MGSDWIENLLNEYEREYGTGWRFYELSEHVCNQTHWSNRRDSNELLSHIIYQSEVICNTDTVKCVEENSTIHPFKKERFVVSEDGDISIEGGVVF